MKNKAGIITGFITGTAGFLLLFKLIFLPHISPEDELAPGVVIVAAILNGLLCAFIGEQIQQYFVKRRKYKM